MSNILALSARTLAGDPLALESLRGKVVLFVNVASECGLTPQYSGLEALQRRYAERGFTVVGVPSNDFGAQEPGSASDIATFCKSRYDVTFPMLEKQSVSGASAAPLFKALAQATNDAPKWNFHKYLVDKEGQVLRSFSSRLEPLAEEVVEAIEEALSA